MKPFKGSADCIENMAYVHVFIDQYNKTFLPSKDPTIVPRKVQNRESALDTYCCLLLYTLLIIYYVFVFKRQST